MLEKRLGVKIWQSGGVATKIAVADKGHIWIAIASKY